MQQIIRVGNRKARPGKAQEERLICIIDRPTNQATAQLGDPSTDTPTATPS